MLAVLLIVVGPVVGRAETNWPAWGGPSGTAHTSETSLPVRWTADNVVWKVALPGSGQSTPVIWGNRVFLTASLDNGRERRVIAVDRRDGRTLWQQMSWRGEPEPSHAMNGWASSTCATDGKVLVAFFGRGGLHGYSLDGEPLWSRDLGEFAGPWGTAASPVIHGETVIQNCDSESKESSLLAVNSRTGENVWSTPRASYRGWSTPLVIRTQKREELLLNSQEGVRSYDPATGRELWWCQGFSGRGEPVPAYAHGLVYVVNGLAGDVYSVRPDGEGDVTKTHRAWHTPRKAGRDLPSPIVIDNYLLAISMNGVLSCYDCASGKELWKERLGAKYSASPLVVGRRAYFQNDEGETTVVEPGEKMTIVATSKLESPTDELFRAAIVPSLGQLFIRSTANLYCIGESPGGK
jgi:outer membrane protein assembly factor BamB